MGDEQMTSKNIRVTKSDYDFIKKIAEEDLKDNSGKKIQRGLSLLNFYARKGREIINKKPKSLKEKKKKDDLF